MLTRYISLNPAQVKIRNIVMSPGMCIIFFKHENDCCFYGRFQTPTTILEFSKIIEFFLVIKLCVLEMFDSINVVATPPDAVLQNIIDKVSLIPGSDFESTPTAISTTFYVCVHSSGIF